MPVLVRRACVAAAVVTAAAAAVVVAVTSTARDALPWALLCVVLVSGLVSSSRARARQEASAAGAGKWPVERVRALVAPDEGGVSRVEQVRRLRRADPRLVLVDAVRLVTAAAGEPRRTGAAEG